MLKSIDNTLMKAGFPKPAAKSISPQIFDAILRELNDRDTRYDRAMIRLYHRAIDTVHKNVDSKYKDI